MEFLQGGDLSVGVRTVKDTTETGLTISGRRNPTDIYMPFEQLRDVIIFVSSPGEYMLFVGKERYTGDLSDLKPLEEWEEMSELELDIRQAHFERSQEVDCPFEEGGPTEWIYPDSD